MNLKQIRYFTRIVETGNLSRAAEQSNVAQTALGLQLKNLEAELGVRLVERHSRGVRITPEGRLFNARALSALALLDSAVDEVRRSAGVRRKPVRLGLTPSIMQLLGAELFAMADDFSEASPVKFVEALSFNLLTTLQRGEIDCALAFNMIETPGIRRTALLEEKLFFVTEPDGMNGKPVSFEETLQSDLAFVSQHDIIWTIVHERAGNLSLDVAVAFEVQSTSAIKTLIERGVATSIMPFGIVSEEVREGTLSARPIDDVGLVRTLYLIRPGRVPATPDDAFHAGFVPRLLKRYAEGLGPYARVLKPAATPGTRDREPD